MVALLPRLRRFAFGLTGSRDEADDLVQAACERALSRLHQWQPGTRLDSWLYRIAQTLWIDQLRVRKNRGDPVEPEVLDRLPASGGRSAEGEHMLARVSAAMDRLPEEQRLVLVLVSVEGLSYQEAAEVLEVPVGTVMSRLARARKRLHALVHGPDDAR
jgi:RNA polymerase sigma-70 factor, ECF subfamily